MRRISFWKMASNLRKYKYMGKTSTNELNTDMASNAVYASAPPGPEDPSDMASMLSEQSEQTNLADLKKGTVVIH